jgi:hypothetical protein
LTKGLRACGGWGVEFAEAGGFPPGGFAIRDSVKTLADGGEDGGGGVGCAGGALGSHESLGGSSLSCRSSGRFLLSISSR